jgi:hypothetical protein
MVGADEVLLGMNILRDYNVQFHGAKKAIQISRGEVKPVQKAEEIVEAIMPTEAIEEVVSPEEGRKSRMDILKQTLREVVPR